MSFNVMFAVLLIAGFAFLLAVRAWKNSRRIAAEQNERMAARLRALGDHLRATESRVDTHFEQAQKAMRADEAILRALAGASFGPAASVVLPSGRRISGDEAQALAAFYAPAAERGEVR